ncbi:Molybdenum cofactor sulfurase [Exserohilum turcicum]
MRIIIIGIVAEYKGDMIDVAGSDEVLGYNLSCVLAQLFGGTRIHKDMAREFRCFLLVTSDKASSRGGGLLFRRYVAALAKSPRQWFRMRDTDALIRFTIGAALACNDLDNVWYSEEELEILDELGATLYDSVAFFKHRSEGETNSTFAYVPDSMRIHAFHQCREALWALDVAWAGRPDHLVLSNFLRFFGGPIHMMMRRYRFVEEGLTIGKPETVTVVKQARQHVKLWNRVGAQNSGSARDVQRYKDLVARKDELMFDGLGDFLDENNQITCRECLRQTDCAEKTLYAFGGVQLCGPCRDAWGAYVNAFPERLATVFPEVATMLCQAP